MFFLERLPQCSAILSTGRTVYDRRHDWKIFDTYVTPRWEIRVSGPYRGTPYARIINSFGPGTSTFPLTQTFMIYAEPVGTYEEPAQSSRASSVPRGSFGPVFA